MTDPVSFLFHKKRKPAEKRSHSVAVIDVGSNSIRLVVFAGPRRNPALIFNEKVMAGLGSGLAETGAMKAESMERGLTALRRFARLLNDYDVSETICVATAAVRDASNGAEFREKVAEIGFDIRVLSGEEEAQSAAYGVLSSIPHADGIVGDLGGGSLELARISGGTVQEAISLPVGVLRSEKLVAKGAKAIKSHIADLIEGTSWANLENDLPLYVVGGSWRGLARVDMFDTGYPLTVFHNYHIAADRIKPLVERVMESSREDLRAVPRLANSRIDTLPNAAQLLQAVTSIFKPAHIVVSSYGLREGLIYQNMPLETRAIDPFLDSTRRFGRYQSRHGNDGTALFNWMLGAFPDLDEGEKRLMLAACHLSDIGWQANPDFRAERALEIALHGNWVGIDAAGRAILAQALYTNFGGGSSPFTDNERLCANAQLEMAVGWGLAIRAGQRISGGREEILKRSRLVKQGDCLHIDLDDADKYLHGESVQRRLAKLASYLSLDCQA